MNIVKNNTKGFTLIETIIYIALLALIMGGTLAAAYQLFQGGGKLNEKNVTQDELNFLMGKIEWALGSIDPTKALTPSSGYSKTLSLTRYDGVRIDICLYNGVVYIRENGPIPAASCNPPTTYTAITTVNVAATSLQFQFIPGSGTAPAGIIASTTLSGISASTTRYIRK